MWVLAIYRFMMVWCLWLVWSEVSEFEVEYVYGIVQGRELEGWVLGGLFDTFVFVGFW